MLVVVVAVLAARPCYRYCRFLLPMLPMIVFVPDVIYRSSSFAPPLTRRWRWFRRSSSRSILPLSIHASAIVAVDVVVVVVVAPQGFVSELKAFRSTLSSQLSAPTVFGPANPVTGHSLGSLVPALVRTTTANCTLYEGRRLSPRLCFFIWKYTSKTTRSR